MKIDFRRALARLVPVFMPDLLFRLGRDGKPLFKEFAAAIVPTEFVPGKMFGTGKMKPIDYLVELAEGRIAPPLNLDIATIQQQATGEYVSLPHPAISDAPRRRLEGKGLHRDADRFCRAQRALQILGRRSARRLQELGRGVRSAQSARRPAGRRRAHHAARAAAPRRHDGDPRKQARRAGAAAHAVAAGLIGHAYQYDIASNLRPELLERSECRPHRSADPGRLCHDRLRSGL